MRFVPCCPALLLCLGPGTPTPTSLDVPRYTIEASLVGRTIVSDVAIEAPEAWIAEDGTLRADPASAGSTEAGFRLVPQVLDHQTSVEIRDGLSRHGDISADLRLYAASRCGRVGQHVVHGLLSAPAHRVHARIHDQSRRPERLV